MEQKIIERPALGENEVTQLIGTLEKFIANNNKKNKHIKHNKKEHYHSWTIDERALIIRTVLRDGYNNKQIKWKKIAAELDNGCSAEACKAYYHRVLRQPLLQVYYGHKIYLMANNEKYVIKDADLDEQIDCLTNACISFSEETKTSKKKHPEK